MTDRRAVTGKRKRRQVERVTEITKQKDVRNSNRDREVSKNRKDLPSLSLPDDLGALVTLSKQTSQTLTSLSIPYRGSGQVLDEHLEQKI